MFQKNKTCFSVIVNVLVSDTDCEDVGNQRGAEAEAVERPPK